MSPVPVSWSVVSGCHHVAGDDQSSSADLSSRKLAFYKTKNIYRVAAACVFLDLMNSFEYQGHIWKNKCKCLKTVLSSTGVDLQIVQSKFR